MESEILVVPVGEVETAVLEHVCSSLQETFDRECRLGKALPKPDYAFDSRREQYSAHEILQRIRGDGAKRALGVVDLDLYVPRLNFVFGLADRFRGRAVIALPRLRQEFYGLPEDRRLFLQRVVKEAVHELGHTYGLEHCPDRRCVMAFSNSLFDTDYKGETFCRKCLGQLQR